MATTMAAAPKAAPDCAPNKAALKDFFVVSADGLLMASGLSLGPAHVEEGAGAQFFGQFVEVDLIVRGGQ